MAVIFFQQDDPVDTWCLRHNVYEPVSTDVICLPVIDVSSSAAKPFLAILPKWTGH